MARRYDGYDQTGGLGFPGYGKEPLPNADYRTADQRREDAAAYMAAQAGVVEHIVAASMADSTGLLVAAQAEAAFAGVEG